MKSMFDPACRRELLNRIGNLSAEKRPLWGRMTAPQMIAHLTDQMHHTLGDVPVASIPSPLRLPIVHYLAIYVIPWPKGRVQGPPEAFVTQPAMWAEDLGRLRELVERFAQRGPTGTYPNHALFGRMSARDWGAFCYKHFDHHLRQFGV